ncbi:MAG: hypothetical protein HN392_00255 [Anaerolineae bacterium]|jgi:hypothetical protein|nr:hypothetical protein [Anaerolineae bacterium]MBT7188969.1 hypothetical protein [Anaerolineae bacterium]MBT7990189.1 hypothetical protein [Anaerolineae bacterium]
MNTTLTMNDLDKRAKISSLWVFVFLNMIFRDLHELGRLGFLEEMMTGVVDGVQITEGLMLIGGIMIAVPLLIIPLTQFLNFKANRLANLFMGALQIVSTLGVNRTPDLDNVFFAVIEIAALLLIIRLAWNWKKTRSLMGATYKEI